MSKNYEAIKAHYAGSDNKDLAAMMAPITDRTAWTEMAGFPYAGTYVGTVAIIEGVFKRIGDEWEGYTFTLERLVDGGSTILGIGTYTGTYKRTGKPMKARCSRSRGFEFLTRGFRALGQASKPLLGSL
ncbi:nuclear transport factor 2 family protein [Mesorhizobium sp. 1M-11]|uniref:nuclear transport factor 2 family protein n=1 Tax=Mesorhizobium sp. 1M-11 TaxID=1529006 RepID=UPI0006C746EF|nr:nuclear transport factor 2 family protein [Mesorhizobium sp. 1M-11]